MSESETNSNEDGVAAGHRRQPVGLLVLWCAVVALAGGYSCGHALAALGILGSFSFLLLGAVAGWTAWVVVGVTGKFSAAVLCTACFIAGFIALVFRLRLTDPTMSWEDAFNWLGPSIASDKVFATFAVACLAFGGLLASFFVLRKGANRPAQ